MSGLRQITLSFTDENLRRIDAIMKGWKLDSLEEAVGESLATQYGLVEQAADGFTEVIVRNPKTGQERIMRVPRSLASRLIELARDALSA